MKKIGLLTYYGDNYGACLQAFALQTVIKRMNYDVEIIEYRVSSAKVKLIDRLLNLRNPVKIIKGRIANRKNRLNYAKRHDCFEKFRNEYLNIVKNDCRQYVDFYSNPPLYDGYVCGSDQIWNPYFTNGCDPVRFLDFVPSRRRRIAYAPSIGVDKIDGNYAADMKKYLSKMDNISVREKDGAIIIKSLIGEDVPVVLDPTLLLTKEDWCSLINKKRIDTPYIFCYFFGNLDYMDQLKEFYRNHTGLPIVTFPFNYREIQDEKDIKIFDAGPIDFVNLIKNASLVLTDSFHATAFSINMEVPFYSLLRDLNKCETNMNSRIYTILNKMELETRLIIPEAKMKFPSENIFNVNFSKTHGILEKERILSGQYLFLALDSIKNEADM